MCNVARFGLVNRLFACLLAIFALSYSVPSSAEYCWMVGCKGKEGYIFTELSKDGKKECVFKGRQLPIEGSDAELNAFVHMSNSLPSKSDDGPDILGPGSVVTILGYVGKDKEIARVRIISDTLKK